jgi:hypothetical protein
MPPSCTSQQLKEGKLIKKESNASLLGTAKPKKLTASGIQSLAE